MSVSAAIKRTLKIAVAPSPLNTLLENIPVLSEALLIGFAGRSEL